MGQCSRTYIRERETACETHVDAELRRTAVVDGRPLDDVLTTVCRRLAAPARCLASHPRRTDAGDVVPCSAEDCGSRPGRRPTTPISPTVSY